MEPKVHILDNRYGGEAYGLLHNEDGTTDLLICEVEPGKHPNWEDDAGEGDQSEPYVAELISLLQNLEAHLCKEEGK